VLGHLYIFSGVLLKVGLVAHFFFPEIPDMNELVAKIKEVITPPTEASGYELVEVEWKREPQVGWVVRIYIDKPTGISHEDCERISRELSAVLDVNDIIPHAYSLEVSSPGLDRPLRTAAHFRKFIGKEARVKLQLGVDGRRNFKGLITAVAEDDKSVTLEVDGKEFLLPLDDLERANLEFQL
jgi:ribosome maturation factor RimP